MPIKPATPKGRKQRQNAIGATLADLILDRNHLVSVLDRNVTLDGADWYERASCLVHEIASATHRPFKVAAAVVAVTSPQKAWHLNVDIAFTILASGNPSDPRITEDQERKVTALLALETDSEEAISPHLGKVARKVRAFYRCLVNPYSLGAVVIDRHAMAALIGHPIGPKNRQLDRIGAYHVVAAHYRSIARSRGLFPNEAQAAVWIQWRRENPHKTRDVTPMENATAHRLFSEFFPEEEATIR